MNRQTILVGLQTKRHLLEMDIERFSTMRQFSMLKLEQARKEVEVIEREMGSLVKNKEGDR